MVLRNQNRISTASTESSPTADSDNCAAGALTQRILELPDERRLNQLRRLCSVGRRDGAEGRPEVRHPDGGAGRAAVPVDRGVRLRSIVLDEGREPRVVQPAGHRGVANNAVRRLLLLPLCLECADNLAVCSGARPAGRDGLAEREVQVLLVQHGERVCEVPRTLGEPVHVAHARDSRQVQHRSRYAHGAPSPY
ncbi:hypothetical protein ColKHC_12979 [Colletotrichum higginsianum]|nr:hypothetical protein ColKHC_12979 [Colletotrichum higginsianum]